MTLTPEQKAMLEAPLDPKHVKGASTDGKGPKGDYIEGWHAINELNRVFGFDGWSYGIELHRESLERITEEREGRNGPYQFDQWQAAYTCICTLTVAGVTRQDVGFGSGYAKGVGDAIEGATKEAATDALKRAARTLGNIFGLALYDKSRENVGVELPTGPITNATRDWIASRLDARQIPPGELCKAFDVTSLKAITYEDLDDVKAWIRDYKKEAA